VLDVVAKIRRVLSRYAEFLCTSLDSEGGLPAKELSRFFRGDGVEAQMDQLLREETGDNGALVRSMRIFLLKQLERSRGVSFVRSALQQPPLSSSQWLKQWQDSGEPAFVRFIGENRLPRFNPLSAIPHFNMLQVLVVRRT
jgi:hypothetical protein